MMGAKCIAASEQDKEGKMEVEWVREATGSSVV